MPKPRLNALAVVRDADRVFVGQVYAPDTGALLYRPVGGRIEFGESASDAIIREFAEELGAALTDVRYLATLEARFEWGGKTGHEVSLIHEAQFVDAANYHRALPRIDKPDEDRSGVWVSLADLRDGTPPLVPEGLLALLLALPRSAAQQPAVLGLHHAQITIPPGAEDAARHFYCDLLGLPEIDKPASLHDRGALWLQIGEQQVHIGVERGVNRRGTGAHLAYRVTHIRRWQARLMAAGFVVHDSIPIPGYERFECRDPFGNRVEFIQQGPGADG